MKFTAAWAKVASENVTLKVFAMGLIVVAMGTSFLAVRVTFKEPIVIDRGCIASRIELASSERTPVEIRSFVEKATGQRFNVTEGIDRNLFSQSELDNREKEFKELKEKNVTQRVLVSEVKLDGEKALVLADRLLAIGKVKTVIPIEMSVQVATTERTPNNPYGLIVATIERVEHKEEGQKDGVQ